MNGNGHLGMAATFAALYQYNLAAFHSGSDFYGYAYSAICFGAAILGGKAPDWDLLLVEKDADWQKRCQIHRQVTHSFLLIVSFFIFAFLMAKNGPWWEVLAYFAVGLMSHLVADLVTGTVPIGLYADNRKTYARIGIRNDIVKKLFVLLGQILGPIFFFISIYQFFMFASKPGFNVIDTIRSLIGSF